jgi:DNA end-binding protein Ku
MASKAEDEDAEAGLPRPFWSGTIAFGLVALPVGMYAANRGRAVSLRMVDEDGTPLGRRYWCEKEDKALSADEIVRGYELDGDYVLVEDDELEAIAPEKSRQIDLTRFVPVDEVDPMYFDRAYFLVPEEGSSKAYRLLARAMEDERRAGIATFVMREKEYLAAIVAEQGVLRVETLRFADELRQPDEVGLPDRGRVPAAKLAAVRKALKAQAAKRFDPDELSDRHAAKLKALVARKLAAGTDVHELPGKADPAPSSEDNVLDIVEILKQRLKERAPAAGGKAPAAARAKPARTGTAGRGSRGDTKPSRKTAPASKARLYARAQKLQIPGRSRMSRDELARAVKARG